MSHIGEKDRARAVAATFAFENKFDVLGECIDSIDRLLYYGHRYLGKL